MTAYCLWDVREVHDEDALDEYVRRVTETVEALGGEYVVIGGPWEVVEGDWRPTFPVLIVFPTIERAHAWYDSEEYRPLRDLRMRAAACDAVFMDSAGAVEHLADTATAGMTR